jgi:HK97 family phage portal protein
MNFLQRAIGKIFLGEKTMDIASLIDAAEKQGWISNTYSSRVNEGYKRNTTAYAAIQKVAVNCACVPWLLFRTSKTDEEDEEISLHETLTLMNRPSQKVSRVRFIEELITYLLISGHSFTRRISAESLIGRPSATALINLMPDRVKRNKNGTGWLYGDDPQSIPEEDMLHLNFLDPLNEDGGLSPIEVASMQIDQGNSARLWNRNLLRQGARPSGMIKTKMSMSPEHKQDMLNSFLDRVAGASKAGLPIISTGDIDWQSTGMSPGEMEWMQGMVHADRGVAVAVGVPPQVLGDTESSTFSNYQEARKALYQERVLPLLNWIIGEFTQFLLISQGDSDLYFQADLDSVDALQEDRKDEWARVKEADWLTVNEKRIATRYGAISGVGGSVIITSTGIVIREDGSVLLPSTLIPMETIDAAMRDPTAEDKPPAPAPAPAPEPAPAPMDDDEQPAGKFFSLITEDQKKAHWFNVEALRRAFVLIARVRAARIFQTERVRVVEVVKNSGTVEGINKAVDKYIDASTSSWEDYYLKTYSQVGAVFARRAYNDILKSSMVESLDSKAKVINIADKWLSHIQSVIVEDTADKVVGIGQATKDKIKAAVQRTIDAGLSVVDAAKEIDSLYLDDIIPNRSEVIARTEVVGASNQASNFAAEETGLKLKKEWIRTYDDRIRDTHKDVTEKPIAMDKPFSVGGSLMMYPGDSSLGADAGEIINCRCTVGYIPQD